MIKRINGLLTSVLTLISSLLLIGIVLCVLLAVFDRTLLRIGFFWTEEMARILFVWFAMIAPNIMAAKEKHFQMTFFFDKVFRGKGKEIAQIIIILVVIATLLTFAYNGYELCKIVLPQKLLSLRSASMAWLYASLPIGMLLMAFINFLLLAEKVMDLFCKNPESKEVNA